MKEYTYVTLRQKPELKEEAAVWFHDKWEVPQEAYLECMEAYLNHETEYGWYLCLDSGRIVGGLGVIENDFHDRKDLKPNVCAVYTEKEYRCQGIAGQLLDIVVKDMKSKGITPIYLITDHESFYERYGWEFLFLGANMDAIKAANHFGISRDRAVNYECDSIGTAVSYEVISKAVSRVRRCTAEEMDLALGCEWKKEIEEDYKRRHRRR